MAERRRSGGAAIFYVLIGLILLALPMAYVAFLAPKPPPPRPLAPPVPAKIGELTISEVGGAVQIRRGTGEWQTAKKGEQLKQTDGVRTSDGSYAVLAGGDAYEVKMESGTQVSIAELSESIARLSLGSGMATARVKGRTFEVKAAGSDAVARTSDGTFAISNNGAGTVAVGTRDGEVEFLGSGKVVIVKAGQQSIVTPESKGPSEPVAVPSSLLLKVALPGSSEQTSKKIVVAGQTLPGTSIQIAGKMIRVDASGKFSQPLVLKEGATTIDVKAIGVGGLSADSTHRITVDSSTRAPSVAPPNWDEGNNPP